MVARCVQQQLRVIVCSVVVVIAWCVCVLNAYHISWHRWVMSGRPSVARGAIIRTLTTMLTGCIWYILVLLLLLHVWFEPAPLLTFAAPTGDLR